MKIECTINGVKRKLETEGSTPLLWVLRDELGLKGTKFGCGKAACGACTVHVNGTAIRSCSYPIQAAQQAEIRTIEGLGNETALHAVQQAWQEEIVPQCGYCQPGFMMAAAALIDRIPDPTDEDIDQNITNICRCGTYYRMRKAIHRAVAIQQHQKETASENSTL